MDVRAESVPCRVTIEVAGRRLDVGLPADVPLAELLPSVIAGAGTGVVERAGEGWALHRLTGPALDPAHTAAQAGIRHGELLALRPIWADGPVLRVDDVVDAIGSAAADLPGRWRPAAAQLAGLGWLGAALAAGLVPVLFGARLWPVPSLVSAGLAAVLLAAAAIAGRSGAGTDTVFGFGAVGYATVAGFTLFDSHPVAAFGSLPGWAVASAAALGTATLAAALLPARVPEFAGAAAAAGCGLAGVAVAALLHAGPAGAAAAALSVALLAGGTVPMFAFRLSRLPAPFIPGDRPQLADGGVEARAEDITAGTARADRVVTALVAAGAVLAALATPAALVPAGWAGPVLGGTAALALVLRARHYRGVAQRAWCHGGALAVLGALAIGLTVHSGSQGRLLVLAGLVAVAALSALALPPSGGTRRWPPTLGRLADLIEVLAVVALLPVALQLLGVYGHVRQLGG